ncbi:MAG: MBOAT family protein [Verrucomicrobiae bacterium]|nr:MBOAT family protein [Verrucomicrobiae bacterium]
MNFVSLVFVVFYPVVLVLYHLLHRRLFLQNLLVLAANLFFYGWWNWRFLGLLVCSACIDYAAARVIDTSDRSHVRRLALVISVGSRLAVLFLFKYFDFFARSLEGLLSCLGLHAMLPTLGWVLPLGISFYTFQSIAYVVDVYRGQTRAEKNLVAYLAFISFFPLLAAGPIERASHLLTQFQTPRTLTLAGVRAGLWLMAEGFFLKVVVADGIAPLVRTSFCNDPHYGWHVILGTLAFGLQIYGDFNGYSTIAKGAAGLLGFDLVWNFNRPYAALSIQDFWRRWHISFSRWILDYLFMPLLMRWRDWRVLGTAAALTVTFLLSGLWHGANWTFIVWGAIHGAAMVSHYVWTTHRGRKAGLPRPLAWALTMTVVFVGWFFFRAENWTMVQGMASALTNWRWTEGHTALGLTLAGLACPVVFLELVQAYHCDRLFFVRGSTWRFSLSAGLLAATAWAMTGHEGAQFIYFKF